jgi:hypothetical protein
MKSFRQLNNMNIPNEFEIKQIVFLIHDIEQLPRMVVAIIWDGHKVMYELISGTTASQHYEFELSNIKTIY